ncbi:MAG: sirohydrochlorin chelatase, partial [Planctomycetia bacterium]|nr:sirohydrochlorin chelatase [Planctomycetia bacterium]
MVGHGTADPVGAGESRDVADLVAAMLPGVPVELGFLEVIGPSIGEALLRLAARECRRIVAAPLLLFTAGHAREDVPAAVREGAAIAGVSVRQAAALGCHEKLVALSRLRRRRAIAAPPERPAEETVLVMVGRGSSDPSAAPQLREFTEATLASAGEPRPGRVELGFVAAARPSLAEAIAS